MVSDILAIAEMEVRKLRHDPSEVLTRAVQPTLWLLIFGQAFGHLRAFDTGALSYQAFMTPGILSQSVMFIAIFFGISVIWEKDLGILQKFLAMPVSRLALVLGKALAAGVRALIQAAIVLLLAALSGVPLRWHPVGLVSAALVAILGAVTFASLSMVIAALVKTRERFMGIGQLLTMPLFFASNALYPLSVMPGWLRAVAAANPLSYMVDFLRGALVTGQLANWPADVGVLLASGALCTALATRLYPKVVL
jgi:ABC-2 type transport system permease protein